MKKLKFRTELKADSSADKISHKDRILLVGSCFSNNIGEKLLESKFQVEINPFGVLFNPISIVNSLHLALKKSEVTNDDIISSHGRFYHYDFHSCFSGAAESECLQKIQEQIERTHAILNNCDYLFFTLGTSWVYRLKKNQKVVANCHKSPEGEFDKELLEVDEIIHSVDELISAFKISLPKLKVIFTVSPIRHVKDGLHENQLSKASLLLAVNALVNKHENCSYFPSYEIMMDDLRDYRFYTEDLIHPSTMAIDYIWQSFAEHYFSIATYQLLDDIYKINRDLSHRSFHPQSDEHQKFLQKLEGKINRLSKKHHLNFREELDRLKMDRTGH